MDLDVECTKKCVDVCVWILTVRITSLDSSSLLDAFEGVVCGCEVDDDEYVDVDGWVDGGTRYGFEWELVLICSSTTYTPSSTDEEEEDEEVGVADRPTKSAYE